MARNLWPLIACALFVMATVDHIDPDGTGSANYAATSSSGHTDYVELRLDIVNPEKLEFQSPGWENRDWSSVQTQMQSGQAGLIGEMRRKTVQPAP